MCRSSYPRATPERNHRAVNPPRPPRFLSSEGQTFWPAVVTMLVRFTAPARAGVCAGILVSPLIIVYSYFGVGQDPAAWLVENQDPGTNQPGWPTSRGLANRTSRSRLDQRRRQDPARTHVRRLRCLCADRAVCAGCRRPCKMCATPCPGMCETLGFFALREPLGRTAPRFSGGRPSAPRARRPLGASAHAALTASHRGSAGLC